MPCSVHAAKQAIKYITHLTESAPDTLLHNCWNSIKNTSAPGTWPRKFVDMCSVIGANHENKVPGILAEFSSFFQKAWENFVTRPDGKLRTYSKFKPKLGLEKYLSDVKNISHRHALCRLRTSSHTLLIERGRYARPLIPVEKRLCIKCNKVEDEHHFVMECSWYDNNRATLFDTVKKFCHNFEGLSSFNKFIYLLSAEGEVSAAVAKFCFDSFDLRRC